MIDIEICIHSQSSDIVKRNVENARRGGASRIELCSDMHLDGLTPLADHIVAARAAFENIPGLLVMIRPRAGDFVYSTNELSIMRQQIKTAAAMGANGVVVGVLRKKDARIDAHALRSLVQSAHDYGLEVTFHRAFDAAPDAFASLDELVDIGVNRVLTSGIAWGKSGGAMDGLIQLRRIIARAADIEVVIGGGVAPGNARQIIQNVSTADMKVSLHAYSSVLINGLVSADAVRALVAVNKGDIGPSH